jgi:F-type H+-transporting ATPase subunit gamma
MAQTRELKRRIKGITSTKKITKAMELVSASKMRRAVQAALATRAYAVRAWEILVNLSEVTDPKLHRLLTKRPAKRALLVVFSSDRGLAGGLTTQLVRTVLQVIERYGSVPVDLITVGSRAEAALVRSGANIVASWPAPSRQTTLADVLPISRLAIDQYMDGSYDRVTLIGTDYLSPLAQKPRARTILPISRASVHEMMSETGPASAPLEESAAPDIQEYLFEPSPDVVLEAMLLRLVEMQLFQGLLEASASEHAARMLAMRNATDAATDLIDELTLVFNKARQANITKDLSEISASKIALAS